MLPISQNFLQMLFQFGLDLYNCVIMFFNRCGTNATGVSDWRSKAKEWIKLIEKCSRLNFDKFWPNKMTANEPNYLHAQKQTKERKNIATAQCACSRTSLFASSHRSWKTKFTLWNSIMAAMWRMSYFIL